MYSHVLHARQPTLKACVVQSITTPNFTSLHVLSSVGSVQTARVLFVSNTSFILCTVETMFSRDSATDVATVWRVMLNCEPSVVAMG